MTTMWGVNGHHHVALGLSINGCSDSDTSNKLQNKLSQFSDISAILRQTTCQTCKRQKQLSSTNVLKL